MTAPYYTDTSVTLHHGDCLDVLREIPDASVDAIVTDPPYGLEFMGRDWDSFHPGGKRPVIGDADGTPFRRSAGTPSWAASGNPRCRNCGGTKYDRTRPTGCSCERPDFPAESANHMRTFQAWCEMWATECLRVLKPGGHLLAFGGSRTWHRLAAAIEDAGFEVRDSIAWLYGSGFPKSLDVSRAIDARLGAERTPSGGRHERANPGDDWRSRNGFGGESTIVEGRERRDTPASASASASAWRGWGTALKPSFEPIVVARKPLAGTVAANVLAHGTGALNIDGARVGGDTDNSGRWPANVVLDDDQAAALDTQSGTLTSGKMRAGTQRSDRDGVVLGKFTGSASIGGTPGDSGGASRFFPVFRYEAKAPTSERPRAGEVMHPTVKPLDLMRWLVRLVTPPGGVVLEPFAGSGTTAEACVVEGFRCIAIEREADYLPLIVQRLHRRDVTAPATVEVVPGAMQDGFDFGEVSA